MSEASAPARFPGAKANRKDLTTAKIVFLVVAAAGPLAAMIGNMPLGLGLVGLAMPAAFVFVGCVLLCFSIGYAAMSREVVNTGAFYTYVERGFGKPAAAAAAYAAVFSYSCYAIGLAAGFGYFASLVFHQLGPAVPWQLASAAGLALVSVFGYRSIDLSARALAVLMLVEIALLFSFDLAVIVRKGFAALPGDVWFPHNIFTVSIGAGIAFTVVCFVGFESAALYGEEARDPARSVPRATYISLGLIASFYLLTVWCMIGAAGANAIEQTARAQGGNLMFALMRDYLGDWFVAVCSVFLVTGLFAAWLALHNAASRYLFAVARDHLLPGRLATFHPRYHSPHVASLVESALALVVVGGLALLGMDPYVGIGASVIGAGTIGIIALQTLAAFAIAAYFIRRPGVRLVRTIVASLAGGAGLGAALVLVIVNYPRITGSDSALVDGVPILLFIAALGGLAYSQYLRATRPERYAEIGRTTLRADTTRSRPRVAYRRRYCIVGAGPAGLIMARALLLEGVPFDCFEKHDDVGGIWDPENTGSPMYESAHFISSKWTSYFVGYPMPDSYPDYPGYRAILAYIRSFADAFGLREHITFRTTVERAEREGDGWLVTLSTGERRYYDGLICAPGVTWHPNAPQLKGAESFRGELRHSVTYRSGDEFAGRRVLVVGAGNSGVDIACDAARRAARAFISVRRGYRFVPKHIFGVPTDVFIGEQLSPPKGVAFPNDLNALLDALSGDLVRLGLPKPDHDALTSHPIMNTQILHHLAHGDIVAKPDIERLDGSEVVFKDGTREEIDVVLLATGYEYRLPFLDEELFTWRDGHPELYLNIFHRTIDSLYVLGFTEFADAAYRRFEEMAQAIVADIASRETGADRELWIARKATDRPDLRGGMKYVDSPRHANYVDSQTYQRVLGDLRRLVGWPDVTATTYDVLRKPASKSEAVERDYAESSA